MQYIKDMSDKAEEGFSFDNYKRNQFLIEKKIVGQPKFVKTGTTIAGMIFKVVKFFLTFYRMVLS